MENTYKKHLGKVCGIDKEAISRSTTAFSKYIVPSVAALKEAYEVMDLAEFDQAVFNALLQPDGIKKIAAEYEESLNEFDLSKMDLKTLNLKNQKISALPEVITDLRVKRSVVIESYNQALKYGNGQPVYLTWESFRIINGKAVLNESDIHEKATIKITTDIQAESYHLYQCLEVAYNNVIDFYKKKGTTLPGLILEQFELNEKNGTISVQPLTPFLIDRLVQIKQFNDNRVKQELEKANEQKIKHKKEWDAITHDLNGKPYPTAENVKMFDQKLIHTNDDAA